MFASLRIYRSDQADNFKWLYQKDNKPNFLGVDVVDKRKSLLWSFLLFVLLASLFRVGPISQAAVTPTVSVDPLISYAEVGEHFNVSVTVADAVNIYAWQVQMMFNTTLLECINATEGDFLATQPETDFYKNIDNTAGYIGFGTSTRGEFSGVNGHGTLGSIEFEVQTEGESTLNITNPYTLLVEIFPPPVPPGQDPLNEIDPNKKDGFFYNIDEPPTADFTYSPTVPAVNQTITFDASASYTTPPREIVQYEWDFGDDTNDTGMIVEHNYTTPGIYTVTLTVTDNATGTELVHTTFDTTETMPHIWYELYSRAEKVISMLHEHDIEVTSVDKSEETIEAGGSVDIYVTVANKGLVTEDFNVTAYYGETAIETKTVTGLGSGASETLTFTWDTSGVPEGTYDISAEADVENEGNPADNVFVDGSVTVKASGGLPITPIAIGVVIIVIVVGAGAFLYMRRKRTLPPEST